MLRLFLKTVESLVAHKLFELVGEFAGIDVGRHGLAVVMKAVCHGGGGGGGERGEGRTDGSWLG